MTHKGKSSRTIGLLSVPSKLSLLRIAWHLKNFYDIEASLLIWWEKCLRFISIEGCSFKVIRLMLRNDSLWNFTLEILVLWSQWKIPLNAFRKKLNKSFDSAKSNQKIKKKSSTHQVLQMLFLEIFKLFKLSSCLSHFLR